MLFVGQYQQQTVKKHLLSLPWANIMFSKLLRAFASSRSKPATCVQSITVAIVYIHYNVLSVCRQQVEVGYAFCYNKFFDFDLLPHTCGASARWFFKESLR